MKKFFASLLFSLCFLALLAGCKNNNHQAEIQRVLDTSLQIMQSNSVNSSKLDWVAVRKDMKERAKELEHPYEMGPIFRELMKQLNDYHGNISYAESTFRWSPVEPKFSDSIMNEWKKTVYHLPQLIDQQIGYIRVPAMPYANEDINTQNAQRLSDSLCYLYSKGIKGLIIDLRLNGGGMMHPMILGLESVLGNGVLGSFETGRQDWKIRDHTFYVGSEKFMTIKPTCDKVDAAMPVVVLTGPGTNSSGEFTLMTFKGRANTRIIGNKSGGYITVNKGFRVDDYLNLLLSVGYGSDRNGNKYMQPIEPDEEIVSTDKFNDLKSDQKVMAASQWLVKQIATKK